MRECQTECGRPSLSSQSVCQLHSDGTARYVLRHKRKDIGQYEKSDLGFREFVMMYACGAVATFRQDILPLSTGYKMRAVITCSTATGMLGSTG